MDMTPQRWKNTGDYITEVFGAETDQQATLMRRAVDAGLPDIAVDAAVGRLLALLAATTNQGRAARRIIEVGTLAGYSALWLAQGLAPGGRLITIEVDPDHAAFAQAEFERAGIADRVEIRIGAALDVLPGILRELEPAPIDVAFLDAVKTEYTAYTDLLAPRLAPGALLIADNALGAGDWWIDTPQGHNAARDAMDAFNRRIALDPRFHAACVPLREGLVLARKHP
ncbi:MAG: O-methyltransferase [Phycisphaerales bacterium]